MYEKNLITKPTLMPVPHHELQDVKGVTWPPLTYLDKKMVPGSPLHILFRWIWEVPDPNDHMPRHSHSGDEFLVHFGIDRHHQEDLGAEFTFMVGDENLTVNKSSVLYIPGGVEHCPMIWKRVDKPVLELAITLGEYD